MLPQIPALDLSACTCRGSLHSCFLWFGQQRVKMLGGEKGSGRMHLSFSPHIPLSCGPVSGWPPFLMPTLLEAALSGSLLLQGSAHGRFSMPLGYYIISSPRKMRCYFLKFSRIFWRCYFLELFLEMLFSSVLWKSPNLKVLCFLPGS